MFIFNACILIIHSQGEDKVLDAAQLEQEFQRKVEFIGAESEFERLKTKEDLYQLLVTEMPDNMLSPRGYTKMLIPKDSYDEHSILKMMCKSRRVIRYTDGPITLDCTNCTISEKYINNVVVEVENAKSEHLRNLTLLVPGDEIIAAQISHNKNIFTSYQMPMDRFVGNEEIFSKLTIRNKASDLITMCSNNAADDKKKTIADIVQIKSLNMYFVFKNFYLTSQVVKERSLLFLNATLATVFLID